MPKDYAKRESKPYVPFPSRNPRYDSKDIKDIGPITWHYNPVNNHYGNKKDQDEKGTYILGLSSLSVGWQILVATRSRGRHASEFYCLSPIDFATSSEIDQKLKERTKSNKRAHVAPLSPEVIEARCTFERSRILWRVLNGLDSNIVDMYGVKQGWVHRIRLVAFAANAWESHEATLEERIREPDILDAGWTEWSLPEFDIADNDTSYFQLTSTKTNPEYGSFSYGTPKDQKNFKTDLRNLFDSGSDEDDDPQPIILLVNGEQSTVNVIRNAGVDTTYWQSGLSHLLYGNPKAPNHEADTRALYQNNWPNRSKYPPVYVVDIWALYRLAVGSTDHKNFLDGGHVGKMMKHLGLPLDKEPNIKVETGNIKKSAEIKVYGECAGNDCRYFGDIWRAFSEGPSVINNDWPVAKIPLSAESGSSVEPNVTALVDDDYYSDDY